MTETTSPATADGRRDPSRCSTADARHESRWRRSGFPGGARSWTVRLSNDVVLLTYGPHARQTFIIDGRDVGLDYIAAEPYVAVVDVSPALGIWNLREQIDGGTKLTATGPRRGCLRHGVAIVLARRYAGV